MAEIKRLVEILQKLLAPGGCPWDQAQTVTSMVEHVRGELEEVEEAIDDPKHLQEEIGDVLANVLLMALIADPKLESIPASACAKMIRRHPHIFGDAKAETPEEALELWNEAKKRESSTLGDEPGTS